MTTKRSKGRITGAMALTLATDVALADGDYVEIVSDYQCQLSTGAKPIVGSVSVRSVKRVVTDTSVTFPVVGTTGSQVTVEALGFSVDTVIADGVIAAGVEVGIDSSGNLVTRPANSTTVSKVGISLMAASAAGVEIDILTK